MDNIYKKLDLQLELIDDNDEESRLILSAARAMLESKVDDGSYRKDFHSQFVADVADESIQDSLYRLGPKYPYLADFSVGEFLCFVAALDQLLATKSKRKRGRPKKTAADAAQQVRDDVAKMERFYQGLRHNQMTDSYEYLRIDPKSGKLAYYSTEGDDLMLLSTQLAMEHGEHIPAERAKQAFIWAARQNPFEPQAEMLDKCRAQYPDMTLEDARKLMSTIGTRLLGAFEDEPTIDGQSLRDRYFARFFINLAFLARNPGDTPTWMPILIGAQGCGKSQLCTHMIPTEYQDLFQQLATPIETLNREPYRLHIGFLLELPEIDAQMRGGKTTEQMKNLVTTRIDACRKPYSPQPVKMVRRFGLIGTTNRSDLFQDGSGERRYLPFQIPAGYELPWREMRDGLNCEIWAAADLIASTFRGSEIELRGFTTEEMSVINGWQQNYSQVDPWETKLLNFCRMTREFTPSAALAQIGIEESKQTQQHVTRLNNLMRQKVPGARWMQVRRNGTRPWIWRIESMPPLDEAQLTEVADLGAVYTEEGVANF